MTEEKKDNSLVKRKHRIVKMGDDLVKVDDRNRVIGKVSMSDAADFLTSKDLEEAVSNLATKKELKELDFISREEMRTYKPDLSKFMRKDDANAKYMLAKAMHNYPTKDEVEEKLKSQNFSGLVRNDQLKEYPKKDELGKFVTKEELATIISPALLAKLVTKAQLEEYSKKEDLENLANKSEVILKSSSEQSISGNLKVSGELSVKGDKVRLHSEKEQRSIRIVETAPAKLTDSDEYVIIINETADLFGVLLPEGKKGLRFTIKDGTGSAYHAAIKVVSSSGATIDGRQSIQLDKAYGVLNLIYNGKEWNII